MVTRKSLFAPFSNQPQLMLHTSRTSHHYFSTYLTPISPVNMLWDKFKTLCKSCIDMIPHKMSRTNAQPPWITHNINRCPERNDIVYATKLVELILMQTGWCTAILRKKFKESAHPHTAITYHHSLTNHNKCT